MHICVKLYLFILFCTERATFKLTANIDTASIRRNEKAETKQDAFDDNNIALHESYRPRHKYKMGTGHQEFTKRYADINSVMQGMKDTQCAVMYKNNEPVGILQPYEESYRFLPVQGEATLVDINPVVAKRKSVLDVLYPNEMNDDFPEEKISNTAKFSDDRYPSIFAKFKIDSRLDKSSKDEISKKKSMFKRHQPLDENEIDPIRSTLTEIKSEDNLGVEAKLKNILDDMGLIDDYPNQDIKREVDDENLEIGTNKINLVKEDKTELRHRRDDLQISSGMYETITTYENSYINDEDDCSGRPKFKRFINGKTTLDHTTNALKRPNDVDDYEKRVEREIRDKIQQLKEEVKKEISNLTNSEDDPKRKKRQIVNTLMDEESKSIDPTYNTDENEKIHIRRKRNDELGEIVNSKNLSSAIKNDTDFLPYLNIQKSERNKNIIKYNRIKRESNYVGELDDYEDDENQNDSDDASGFTGNNGKFECNCNKGSPNCKCGSANFNEKLTKIDDKETGPKYINKKSVKQQCSCDKNGNNCKCSNRLKEAIPSIDKEYMDYDHLDGNYNEQNDPLSSYVNKFTSLSGDNQYLADDEYENYDYSNEEKFQKRAIKPRKYAVNNKPFENGEYFVDMQPDIYRVSPAESYRDKRNNFNEYIASHDDSLMNSHYVAIKPRSMFPHTRYRRRVLKDENNMIPRQLIDMSDDDLFGALPQSFDGELLRYKRIKRSKENS